MRHKYNAIIFDVDGVLLDTVPYHFSAWKRMFEEQGVKFTEQLYLEKVNGLPRLTGAKNILTMIKDEKKIHLLGEKKQKYYLEMMKKNPPKPLKGVVKFLKELKKMNLKLAAASSSKNAPQLLVVSGLDIYFDVIVGGADFTKSKPHPEIFLTASKGLNVVPEECIVVEDAMLGIQAAKGGGMKTVGLLTSNDNDIRGNADLVIDSLDNYPKILSTFF